MYVKEKPVTTVLLWNTTWQLLVSLRKPLLQISLGLIFLPALALSFYFAAASAPIAEALQALANSGLAGQAAPNYQEVLAIASPFFSQYAVVGCLYLMALIAGFFAVVRLAVAAAYGEEPLPAMAAVRQGLPAILPRGFMLMLFLAIFSLEQIFFGPFRVFTLFALMAPVLMVTEQRGLWSSLKQAVFMRYASPARGGSFTTSFMLLTLSAMLYAFESIVAVTLGFILHADEWLGLPRSIWAAKLPGLPFSPIYAITHTLSLALTVAALVFVVGFMVSLFFSMRPQVSHRI